VLQGFDAYLALPSDTLEKPPARNARQRVGEQASDAALIFTSSRSQQSSSDVSPNVPDLSDIGRSLEPPRLKPAPVSGACPGPSRREPLFEV
jgi:hypothetical protein